MRISLKYLVLLGGVFIYMSSCKKELLDPIPQTSITDESSFETPDRIANQVVSLYGPMKNGNFLGGRAIVAQDIRGEDFLSQSTNLVTGRDAWLLNIANSTTFVRAIWSQGYLTINRANVFIDGMTAKGAAVVGDALAKNYIGEARLIRALSYYYLLQLYARPYADGNGSKPGLPLRLKGIVGPGESDLARSTVAEVYAQIISDLDFAEANLPASYSGANASTTATLNTTRAHRNTAIALKTRVYLSMQKYDDVIREANKIVPANAPFKATTGVPHEMQSDITNVFKSPYNTTESILSLPMSSASGDNPGTQNQLGFYWYNSTGAGTGEFSLNPNGIIGDPSFGATDRRRQFIYTVTASPNRFYLSKYPTASTYHDWVPVIRWPEVLLNLAEALARKSAGSVDARALALVNAVRKRSDATVTLTATTSAELVDLILRERRLEFVGEGLRNIDLMRLLQTIPAKGEAPAKAPSEPGYIWPISSDELSLNKLMTDNN